MPAYRYTKRYWTVTTWGEPLHKTYVGAPCDFTYIEYGTALTSERDAEKLARLWKQCLARLPEQKLSGMYHVCFSDGTTASIRKNGKIGDLYRVQFGNAFSSASDAAKASTMLAWCVKELCLPVFDPKF